MEQVFAVGSTTEVKYKSFDKQSSCRVPILARLSDHYWNGMGMTATVQCMSNWVLLLSCDNILKLDWCCQLSGSRSNSLNSWKLPGHFSYGLGTRLGTAGIHYLSHNTVPQIKNFTPVWATWRGYGRLDCLQASMKSLQITICTANKEQSVQNFPPIWKFLSNLVHKEWSNPFSA